jgi:PAS domain S-box-containing protein
VRGKLKNASASRIERQLALAQQITHVGSWEWDARTGAVAWSDELYRIYGLEPQSSEVTFESFLARVHPDDRERVQREVGKVLEQGGSFAYSERIIRPDGSVRQLDTMGEAVRDDEGRGIGLIGTCRDVTEERKRDETIRLYADVVHNAQIGLSVWEVEQPDDAERVRLVAFNPAAAAQASRPPLASSVGHSFREIFPRGAGSRLEQIIVGVAREGRIREATIQQPSDPVHSARALAVKAFPLAGRRVGLAVDDITPETQARRLQDAEQRVLEMIASGAELPAILASLILGIEEQAPLAIGSVLLLDAQASRVRHAAAPNLPEAYCRAIDGEPIGPSAGSCGTAAFLGRPVFVEDIEVDPLWARYRDLALSHGLRACWSTPVVATDGRVLGTFALYYRAPRLPTPEERDLIERATHLAGIAIERRQLEDQLRGLTARVESVREEERTGIAREIHDELGQALTALKLDVAWILRRISAEGPPPTERLVEKLREMSDMIDGVIHQMRRISSELRPLVLDDFGLLAALEWQAQEFERRTGTLCSIRTSMKAEKFDRNLSTAVFRIFQEALTNVARHAQAAQVEVRLADDGGSLRLDVEDDGKGIVAEALHSPESLGLLGIRERARRLGGTATIRRATPSGTVVSLVLPLTGERKESAR